MLTGELKNKIDSIWEMFWTGGVVNPLDVVEQMTYLMFIHDLDETDAKKAKSSMMLELPYTSIFEGHEQYKWSVFRDLPAEKMYELMQTEIFPFIKNLHGGKESTYTKYMSDAIFKIPTPQLLSMLWIIFILIWQRVLRATQRAMFMKVCFLNLLLPV